MPPKDFIVITHLLFLMVRFLLDLINSILFVDLKICLIALAQLIGGKIIKERTN